MITAHTPAEVRTCLAQIEAGVARGLYAAGFLAYEAAPGLNEALETHPPGSFPLLWFGLYEEMSLLPVPPRKGPPLAASSAGARAFSVGPWSPELDKREYLDAFARIRELIAAGETYQINYTFPLRSKFEGDALAWFRRLCEAQRAAYAAFVDTGRFKILSVSPELFFRLDGARLETRPMKGTRPRGRWLGEDLRIAEELRSSEKDRAENVMIVDLLRNDMGRISEVGSVRVDRLFEVERYETVWQMTSSISSSTRASASEILAALFPSGSVTGAPKVRAMHIIRRMEPFPRGVYCGAIGWWAPGRQAEFSVAIRTATIDTGTGFVRYSTGGGITWGSTPEGEFEECLTKTAVLTRDPPDFELLESLLFDREYFLIEEHLSRLASSATYWDFELDPDAIRIALLERASTLDRGPLKVRLLLRRDGSFRIESGPAPASVPVKLGFAAEPVSDGDAFLYHKTTHRTVYDRAKVSRPECDDVLLWNPRGEITESTSANVVLKIDNQWVTPLLGAGLLAGTMRAHLLVRGDIREAVLLKGDVARAESVALINSVRKWIPAQFVG